MHDEAITWKFPNLYHSDQWHVQDAAWGQCPSLGLRLTTSTASNMRMASCHFTRASEDLMRSERQKTAGIECHCISRMDWWKGLLGSHVRQGKISRGNVGLQLQVEAWVVEVAYSATSSSSWCWLSATASTGPWAFLGSAAKFETKSAEMSLPSCGMQSSQRSTVTAATHPFPHPPHPHSSQLSRQAEPYPLLLSRQSALNIVRGEYAKSY